MSTPLKGIILAPPMKISSFIPSGSDYIPCDICHTHHNRAFEDLMKVKSEEEFDEYCRYAIQAHYRAQSKNHYYSWGDTYYSDLSRIRSLIKGHFPLYVEIYDRYMLLK